MIEAALFLRHGDILGPGPRHHHHQDLGHGASRYPEELKEIVEFHGVTAVGLNNGQDLLDAILQKTALKEVLGGGGGAFHAAQSVDLTVMGHISAGLSTAPAWEGIGGKAGVYHGDGRFIVAVVKIRIEIGDLPCMHHAFINNGAVRKADHIHIMARFPSRFLY